MKITKAKSEKGGERENERDKERKERSERNAIRKRAIDANLCGSGLA